MYVPFPAVGLAVLCAWELVPKDKARTAMTARRADNLTEFRILFSLQEDTGGGQRQPGGNFGVMADSALSSATRQESARSSGFQRMHRPRSRLRTPAPVAGRRGCATPGDIR